MNSHLLIVPINFLQKLWVEVDKITRDPARGGPMSPVQILKRLVSVFLNACHLLSALPSLSQFGRGRLSLVAISFYALSLLFRSCRLLEFTLAGPLSNKFILSDHVRNSHDHSVLQSTDITSRNLNLIMTLRA